jgi:multidrug transporter EmrE-like cation transporter
MAQHHRRRWRAAELRAAGDRVSASARGYAIWVGIGAVGVAIAGIVVSGETVSAARVLFLSIIVVGIVGLRLVEG